MEMTTWYSCTITNVSGVPFGTGTLFGWQSTPPMIRRLGAFSAAA